MVMADPISALAVISLAASVIRLIYYVKSLEKAAISQTYGPTFGLFIVTFFGDTATEYERIQRVVLRGKDEEALRFRDSVMTECNMTAVAGAIIAQVALTALSLPSLSLVHWTARAFLLFATVAGCLSVYYACTLSREIGKCYHPRLVRDWLSSAIEHTSTATNDEENEKDKTQASLSGIFVLSAPYTMMSFAILAFIIGLAIYQGFVWTKTLDTDAGKDNSRNVFIAYIVSTGFCQLFFLFAGVIKAIESLLIRARSREKSREMAWDLFVRGEEHRQLGKDIFGASTNIATASAQNNDSAPPQQRPNFTNPYGGLAAALEAAAKAHILSAEADRRVASEYTKFLGPQEVSTVVEG